MARSYDEIERVYSLLSLPSSGRVYRGSAGYLESPTKARRSDACDHLIALARSADPEHPLYVVALGCVTNIDAELRWVPSVGSPWMREGHAVQRDAIFNDFFAKLAHLKARQPQ